LQKRWYIVLREEKRLKLKNNIFEVAGRLFKEKGYDNTTVDEITKKQDSKGTFFNYFSNKGSASPGFVKQKEELVFDMVKDQLIRNISKKKDKKQLVLVAKSNEKEQGAYKAFSFLSI